MPLKISNPKSDLKSDAKSYFNFTTLMFDYKDRIFLIDSKLEEIKSLNYLHKIK